MTSTHTAPRAVEPMVEASVGARSVALDRLRGLALVAMLVHHLVDWFTGQAREVLPGWRSFAVTDVAAVAFFCAAGASMALFAASRRRRGTSRGGVAVEIGRRYALLLPIGMALGWYLWRDPLVFGVLEAIGLTVVLAAAITAVLPRRILPVAAGLVLVAGVAVERTVGEGGAGLVERALGGTFPLVTYLGFVLVGAALARSGRLGDRRWAGRAAAVAGGGTLLMIASGIEPSRYPGDLSFVLPGLAATAALLAVSGCPWPRALGPVDRTVRAAGTHALGIFVAHYLIFGVLRYLGWVEGVAVIVAVPASLGIAAALCVVAPLVPQLPWSPRTGRRRSR